MNSSDIEYLREQLSQTVNVLIDEGCVVIFPITKEENIKKLQTENKELKKFITEGITIEPHSTYENYQLDFLRENFISVQKIEEKMQKDIKANEHIILGGRRNGKTLEYGKRLGRIEMCKELLESEE